MKPCHSSYLIAFPALVSSALFVMLSSESIFNNGKQATEGGAKGFIVKPFSINKIVASSSVFDAMK